MDNVTRINHNNSGHKYRIAIDIAKEGTQLWDLTPYFKGRVGDNNFGLQVTWYYQGQLMNVQGMKPYIEGLVGSHSFDKNGEIDMDPGAKPVSYEGSTDDCGVGGKATFYFPAQMFPQDGIFKGFIGLKDDRDDSKQAHISGVTIWFKVLPGVAQMGHACDAYVDQLEKALQNFKDTLDKHDKDYQARLQKVIDDARNNYETQTKASHDAAIAAQREVDAVRANNNNLVDTIQSILNNIKANNIVTRPEFDELSNQIVNRLAQINVTPSQYPTYADMLVANPNGTGNLCVVQDTGHKWLYFNGQWLDLGSFSWATLKPELESKIENLEKRNIFPDPEFSEISDWTTYGGAIAINTDQYNGHGSLRITSDGAHHGGVYSAMFPLNGSNLSMSIEALFSGVSNDSNASIGIAYYDKDNKLFSDSLLQVDCLSLNYNGDKDWHKIIQENITVQDKAKFARVYLKFKSLDLSAVTISEPLLVERSRIGEYSLDDLPKLFDSSDGNLYPDPNYQTLDSIHSSNGLKIVDNHDFDKGYHAIVLDNTNNPTAGIAYTDVIDTSKQSTVSFYTRYSYTGSDKISISLNLYKPSTSAWSDTPLLAKDSQLLLSDNSYHSWSQDNVACKGKVLRIKYVIPAGGKAYILKPILLGGYSTYIPVKDLPLVKPKSIQFIKPRYTIGAPSREYLWIHFDKMIVDYYTDTKVINWKDWIESSAVGADDFSEDNYYVDVGPLAKNTNNHLDYVPDTNGLTIISYQKMTSIPLISWNEDQGFYGVFIDQANEYARLERGGRSNVLNELTSDMVNGLRTKRQEVINQIKPDDFVFSLVTDNHQAPDVGNNINDGRPDYTGMALAKIATELSTDTNISLGDSVLATKGYNSDDNTSALVNFFKYLPAQNWIYTEGNHDRHIIDPILSQEAYYNIVNRTHRNDSRFHFGDQNHGAYFYVDFDERKLRVITLDEYDFSGTDHDQTYNQNKGFRQKQLKWLIDTALNVQDGWQVIVTTHTPPIPGMPENDLAINDDALVQILEAFEQGKSVTITATDQVFKDETFNVNLQTNWQTPHTIIAVLSGHNHVDAVKTVNDINYVSTECGYIDVLLYHSQNGKTAKYGQRDQHTYSAIAFDIVLLNQKDRTLSFKRFGHGQDRELTYVDNGKN